MEQNSDQNKSASFFEKNQNYLIAGVIAVILLGVVYFASTRGDDGGQQNENQQQEQTNQEQNGENQNNGETDNGQPDNSQNNQQPANSLALGDVSAVGALRVSDNPARGNLMLESNRGKIYIATKRDYSGSIGKQLTLQAQGDIKSFTFLGFKEAGNIAQAPTDNEAKGGANEPVAGNVSFSGRLDKSDNSAKGNYQIVSGKTKVYLQSQRDYSSLVGNDVNLSAQGSLRSFTGAIVTKK